MRAIVILLALAGCTYLNVGSDEHGVCGTDAAIDASFVGIDLAAPWTKHTIASGYLGADGVDVAGNRIVSPWEESGLVSVSTGSVDSWSTVWLTGAGAVEGVEFCDVDGDGELDIIAASESQRILIYFGPTWIATPLPAADSVTHWMATACMGPGQFAAGGKLYPGQQVAIFTSPTPRIGSSWTRTKIGDAGWVMTLESRDVDGDGDLDLVLSDRTYYGPSTNKHGELTGARWLEAPTWTNHTIDRPVMHGDPKMADIAASRVIDCVSDSTRHFLTSWTTTNWLTWTATPIFTTVTAPANVGQCQDVATGDIDSDGAEDLVLTYAFADGAKSGVTWIRADGARGEISGPLGTKYDNVRLIDMDGDGDLDVLTSEQTEINAVVWYENPRGQQP